MSSLIAETNPPETPEERAFATGTTRAAEGLLRRRFTVAEIEAFIEAGVMAEGERFELIGGEIVPMSPKGIRHERLKMWVMESLIHNLPREFATNPETTFRLAPDTFLGPDFVVFPRDPGLSGLDGETCRLAIEIGVSSLSYDRGRKAAIYAAFGIRELWVIDGDRLETRLFRDPAPHEGIPAESARGLRPSSSFQDARYATVRDAGTEDSLIPLAVPGFSLRLADFENFKG